MAYMDDVNFIVHYADVELLLETVNPNTENKNNDYIIRKEHPPQP